MPAPQMPGMVSGVDTKELVRKLVELERAPIVRLENNKKELVETNKALTELRKRARTLQDALHAMVSFEAAFEQKRLNTTPAGIIDGTVRKNAPPGKHNIEVIRLATNLSIATAPVESNKKLPEAKIRIAGTESVFRGGTLSALKEHLQRQHGKHLNAKIVNVRENESILIVETIAQGEDALLKIEDPDGLFQSLGLTSVAVTPGVARMDEEKNKDNAKNTTHEAKEKPPEKPEKKETERWKIRPEELSRLRGRINPIDDERAFALEADSMARYALAPGTTERQLEAITLAVQPQAGEDDSAPDTLSEGVRESINIKGIELETYNPTRTRKKEVARDGDYGIVLRYGEREERHSLKGREGTQNFTVKPGLTGIDFFATGTGAVFEPQHLVYSVTPQAKIDHSTPQPDLTPSEAEQRRIFPNLLRAAQNAKLKIDGIEITRKSNSNLSDIIEGVSLSLLKASPEVVSAEISNDSDAAKKQILNFVKAYNELLEYANEVSRSARVTEAGKYREMRADSGILATNATVRQLINGLKMHTSNAYPASREPYYRTLAQIGISTGAIGGKREEVTKGYLEVDEAKLAEALSQHPTAVKELFASDTNGDMRLDNGYAYVTENFLEPFTRFTRGLISEQIRSNQERMRMVEQDIKRHEMHVKNYENKLKARFGYMESAVQRSKATGNFLKQKLGNQDNDNK